MPVHRAVLVEGLLEQVQADAVLPQQAPGRRTGVGGQLQHGGQVVGQLAAVHCVPGGPVRGGEVEQGLAAVAGVAGGVVAQVQAAAAAQVEQVDVLGRQGGRVEGRPVVGDPAERVAEADRQLGQRRPDRR